MEYYVVLKGESVNIDWGIDESTDLLGIFTSQEDANKFIAEYKIEEDYTDLNRDNDSLSYICDDRFVNVYINRYTPGEVLYLQHTWYAE